MLFKDALNKAVDIEQSKNPNYKGMDEAVARAAAFIWNMIAIAQNDGGLEDVVHIDNKLNAVSVKLVSGKAPKEPKEKKEAKEKTAKTNDVNVKEEPTE